MSKKSKSPWHRWNDTYVNHDKRRTTERVDQSDQDRKEKQQKKNGDK